MTDFTGVQRAVPRATVDLGPLLGWLRSGQAATERLDFPAGTALSDGRLDLCKHQLGPDDAALVAEALLPQNADVAPGSPPIGSLLDYAAFFWAEAIIAVALTAVALRGSRVERDRDPDGASG